MYKLCKKCDIDKLYDEFYTHAKNKHGLSHWCKECSNADNRARHAADPQKTVTKNRSWRDRNPDKVRDNKLRREYGITLEQYNQILADQQWRCAICKIHQSELSKNLGVDHDHSTNDIRGLLCRECNTILGMACDNVEILSEAIKYLLKGPLIKIEK